MATIEARGYANKVEHKSSGGGKEYVRFTLAVQQKRKDRTGQEVKEKLFFNCVDFDTKDAPAEGEYVGVTGYITISGWCKDGKGGANLDVTVKSYEKLPQKEGTTKTAATPPTDPFALKPDADLGDGIPF